MTDPSGLQAKRAEEMADDVQSWLHIIQQMGQKRASDKQATDL